MQDPPYRHPPPGRPSVGAPPPRVPPAPPSPVVNPPLVEPPPRRAPRRSRSLLRFLAGTCVFTAWITLLISVLGAAAAAAVGVGAARMLAPGATLSTLPRLPEGSALPPSFPGESYGVNPTTPGGSAGPGSVLQDLMGGPPRGAGGEQLLDLLARAWSVACFGGAALTLVSGLVMFLMFLGLGQACYVLLEVEERQLQLQDTLTILGARLGMRA